MPSAGFAGPWGSRTWGSMSSTSPMRAADTLALGSITNIMAIIKKDIMICIAYWIKAIISPICKVEAAMAWPPTHIITKELTFITSIIAGIIPAITRCTKRLVWVNSWLASRTTIMPERCSRLMRFSLSIMPCKALNFGSATAMTTITSPSITATAAATIQLMETLFSTAKITPPMPIMGA